MTPPVDFHENDPRDPRGRELRAYLARERYARYLEAEVDAILRAVFGDIVADLVTGQVSIASRPQVATFLDRVVTQLGTAYGRVSSLTSAAVGEYAVIEADAAAAWIRVLTGQVGGVPVQINAGGRLVSRQLLRSVAELPIEGLTLGEWWQGQAAGMALRTRRAIQTGIVRGEGTREIAARILPPRDATEPAVSRQARAEARAVVRTSLTTVQNHAAQAAYSQSGVSEEYQYLSARDARVTPICRALDGKRFRYDDPKKKVPPQHIGCRSTTTPVVDWAALGIAPPAGWGKPLGFTSYADWLRAEPQSVQNRILGPSRAALFRESRVTLEQLVADDGRQIPLAKLREQLAAANGEALAAA